MKIATYKIFLAVIVIFISLENSVNGIYVGNNVCSSYDSYFNRQHRKDCWFNPDAFDNVETIVKRKGYPIETHYVTTNDGYILRVFRIPHGVGQEGIVQRKPVLLMSPYTSNSACWVYLEKNSLAFLLADAGYDVWLGNTRGSYYSNQHVNLTTRSPGEYWNFSFHEHGKYDIPAILDYIYGRINGREKIIFIGFSMSSTTGLIYGSLLPNHSSKRVKVFILMAPTTNFRNSKSPLRRFIPLLKLIQPITTLIGHYSMEKQFSSHGIFQMSFINAVCLASPLHIRFCLFILDSIVGYSYFEGISPEYLPVILNQIEMPGCSLKLFYHYFHQWRDSEFKMYDYGILWNKKYYNSTNVPLYRVENMQVPVHALAGTRDFVASIEDIQELYSKFGNEVKKFGYYVVPANPGFAHTDFLMSKHTKQYVYDHIIEFMNSL